MPASAPLIKYEHLTDFQKWLFFYVIKHGSVPRSLDGIMKDMCMTLKMKVNVDDFENEEEKFKKQASQLYDQNLFHITSTPLGFQEYALSDKGELYVIQKILKPLFDAKEKGDLAAIRDYFKTDAEKQILSQFYSGIFPLDPQHTLSNVSEVVLKLVMPSIKILDAIQKFSNHTVS